jgi:HEAT repeat protein
VERCKIDELSVVQLNDDQLEDFLTRHGAVHLYQQMGSELKALARNPFLLWALAQSCVGLAKAELPRNTGQLYRNLIDGYLFETHERRKEPSPTEYNYERVKKPMLASLALKMTEEGVTRRAQDMQLLREVHAQLTEISAAYAGLVDVRPYELMPVPPSGKGVLDEAVLNGVLRRVGNTIEFMHQSVQDYFAAVGMLDWNESQVLNLAPPSSFRDTFERSDEFEAIVMLVGLKEDTGKLLKALNGHNPLLAAHCFSASSTVPLTVRDELIDDWEAMLHQQNQEYRKLACSCLGTARVESEELQQELIDIALFDKEYEVRKAAERSLGQIKSDYAFEYLIDLGLSGQCDDKTLQEISSLLFEIDLGAAVTSLFQKWRQLEVGGEKRRRAEILLTPRSWEESDVSNQLSIIRIDAIRREDTDASQAAKEALDMLKAWQESHGEKLSILTASELRRRVQQMQDLVKSVPSMSISELLRNLTQENYVAGHVATELGKRVVKEGLEPLVETLYRQSIPNNIEPMVHALENIDRAQAAQLLRAGLQTSDFAKQTRAAVALGLMGDFESIALVQKALRVENSAFRSSAAKVLGNFGSDEAVAALADAVQSENDEEVLRHVLVALGNTKSPTAIEALLKVLLGRGSVIPLDRGLSHGEETLRELASRTLVEATGVRQVIARLQESARDKDGLVRARAIDEMVRLEDREFDVTRVLRNAWGDPAGIVRAAALRGTATKAKTNRELREMLEEARKDNDPYVRGVALDEWTNHEIEGALATLIECALTDPDLNVRNIAATKLRNFLEQAFEQFAQILQQDETKRRIAAIKTLEALASDSMYYAGGGWSSSSSYKLSGDNNQKVLTLLERGINDPDQNVRIEAASAMRSVAEEGSKDLSTPVLVDLAWHGESNDIRQRAADLLQLSDTGREALYKPIWDRLDDPTECGEIIKLIGEDQPFLNNEGYLYAVRGFIYQRFKSFERACADYETALKLGFDNAWLRTNYADSLDGLGRYEEALEAGRKAVEYAPSDAEARLALGWYAYRAGDYRKSIEESKIALGLNPTLAMAAFNVGLAYVADHQVDKARTAYDEAVKLCKEMTEADTKATIQAALEDIDALLVAKPKLASEANELKSKLSFF